MDKFIGKRVLITGNHPYSGKEGNVFSLKHFHSIKEDALMIDTEDGVVPVFLTKELKIIGDI